MPPGGLRESVVVVAGFVLLPSGQMRGGDLSREAPISFPTAGKDEQVRVVEAQFGSEDGTHVEFTRGLSEPHHAVETIMVGECKCVEPEPDRLLDEFFGSGGTVEEAVGRVGVQFGVRHDRAVRKLHFPLVFGAGARPRGGVTAIAEMLRGPAGRTGRVPSPTRSVGRCSIPFPPPTSHATHIVHTFEQTRSRAPLSQKLLRWCH